jgi:transposase
MSEDLRVRYDSSVRLRAAAMFAEGHGRQSTAKRLGLPKSTVRKWQRTYFAVGVEGLADMGKRSRSYSWEVKVAAARAVVEGGATMADAMARYGIASQSPLEKWCRSYREGGQEALRPKPKGRPRGAGGKSAGMTREQELERRIQRLEAENAYLKKSIALKAERRSRTARRRPS